MGKLSGIELKRARLVPSAVFGSPDEVLRSAELNRAQKIAILRRWEFDARPTTAHPGARQDGPILDQIREALVSLGTATPSPGPGARPATDHSACADRQPAPGARPRRALS